ncbi:MAG: HAMP domain-containing protein [Candidatus Eremiobacteraeota bacterium]|nr:HAMP domain-containing protein [Candidatus Eremiobacteraeota bacterium]MCW5872853.1 HAMP domain-containing protein [Candidatus Eremiobacteraeota bacterium]
MISLRLRLTLWYALLVLLTLSTFSTVVYLGVKRSMSLHLDHSLEQTATQFVREAEIEKDGDLDLETDLLARGERVAVYNQRKELLAVFGGPVGPGGGGIEPGYDTYSVAGLGWRRLTLDSPELGLRFQISRSEEDYQGFLEDLFAFLLAAVPLTAALTGAGGLFLASRSLNPIDEITRTAANLGAEHLSRRLPQLKSKDELSRLSDTFNEMLERLEGAFERQKQFTSDAAHELRAPLALLTTKAEVTLERTRTQEEYQEALSEIHQSSLRMSRLLSKLLMLARSDAGGLPIDRENFNFADLVSDVVAEMSPLSKSVWLETELEPVCISADQTRMTEVLWNLLDNALGHSPPDSTVHVSLRREKGQAVLRIADQGPGVPPEHRERIFERFYQVDPARTPSPLSQENAGLGLAICRALARQHGGDITLENPGVGATFVLRLPAL